MNKLKGKSEFTVSEINELRRLITLRNKSSRTEQKSIRAEMRKKIGFYGMDDWGIYDCQLSDLENLITTKQITIIKSLSSAK